MNIRKINLEEMLEQREYRQALISQTKEKFADKTIISFKLNIPGPIKNNENYKFAFEQGLKLIDDYKIIHDLRNNVTGPEAILVSDETMEKTKLRMIEIEDHHPLGRLYDLDVLGISRSDLEQAARKCLICEDEAHNCSRSRKHPLEEVLSVIENTIQSYKESYDQ